MDSQYKLLSELLSELLSDQPASITSPKTSLANYWGGGHCSPAPQCLRACKRSLWAWDVTTPFMCSYLHYRFVTIYRDVLVEATKKKTVILYVKIKIADLDNRGFQLYQTRFS